ncbi:porin family protein [uncultured Dokdonia sp.]|uniref:porin family protein n=1 Tax=uncultured Dokdonia sp. TaxID=575653 RepID=UPI00262D0B95|nr:porin family protein [uncultured Dokdonia sp.]
MKKITLLSSILVMLCCSLSHGQGIGYGFKLGVNVSQINSFSFDVVNISGGTPTQDNSSSIDESRIGFTAAFFAEIPINERLSFQPEFAYSSQGNKFEGLRYEYLQLPLALKINLNKLFINAGPQVGLKISAFEQSDNFSSFEFAGFGGLGYQFTDNIFIEARYTVGFTEVFEDDAAIELPMFSENSNEANRDTVLTNTEGKNSYFTLSIGYRL